MQLRVFTEPQQGATYDDLLAVARRAEETGFDAFFRSDHYLAMAGDGLPGPTDAWLTLAGLARETSTIRLGTLMTAGTFRLPGPLAISVAQVDQMSGGRVELGLGAGWFEQEHAAFGIPFPSLGERFDRPTWDALAEAGLLGVAVPEAQGGLGLGIIEQCLVLAEVGRTIAPVPVLAAIVGGVLPLVTLAIGTCTIASWNRT